MEKRSKNIYVYINVSFTNELWLELNKEAFRRNLKIWEVLCEYLEEVFRSGDLIELIMEKYKNYFEEGLPAKIHQVKLTLDLVSELNEISYVYREPRDVIICAICKYYLLNEEEG